MISNMIIIGLNGSKAGRDFMKTILLSLQLTLTDVHGGERKDIAQ